MGSRFPFLVTVGMPQRIDANVPHAREEMTGLE